jgi:hypothetical protein
MNSDDDDVPVMGSKLLKGDLQVPSMVLALVLHFLPEKTLVFPEELLEEVAGMGLIIRRSPESGLMMCQLVSTEEAVKAAAPDQEPDKSKWN